MENAQQIQPKIVKANQILESKKIINHNGFTKTPPITQIIPPIAAIISFLLCLIQIFIMFQKIGERIILSSIIIGLLLINSVLWYMTTKIIPTDSVQLKHIQSIKNNESFDGENSCFCKLCETYVGNHSFHCKKCNRCVQFFDHHCKWLNNCIGAKNYFEFYALVISIFIFLTYCLALSVYFSKRTIEHFHEQLVSVQIFFAFGLFISFLSLVPIGFLIYLIILHTYLIITKRTTISLILESRNKNKIHPIQHQNPKESLFRLELGAQELIEDSLTKEIKDEKIIFKKIQKNKSAHLVLAENNKIKSIQLNDENSMFNDTNQMMVKSSGSSQKQNRGPLSKQSSLQSSIMNPSDILPPIVNKRIKNKITYQFDKVSTPKKVFESYHIENRNKISNYDRSFVKDA